MNLVHGKRKRRVREVGGKIGKPAWVTISYVNYYNPVSKTHQVDDAQAPRGRRTTWRFMSFALDMLEGRTLRQAQLLILRRSGHRIAISTLHEWKKWDGA